MLTNPDASGQHKMKSFIHHMVDPRISDPVERDASKVVGMTPGEPLCLLVFRSEEPARRRPLGYSATGQGKSIA